MSYNEEVSEHLGEVLRRSLSYGDFHLVLDCLPESNKELRAELLRRLQAIRQSFVMDSGEQSISNDDLRRRCEAEGIDPAKVWALRPQWDESGPHTGGAKSALVASDLILRSNGTVVSLDKLMWPWSKGLAEKHVAGQSNSKGLPWEDFVTSVTKLESDSIRIAREIMEKQQGGRWDEKTPYPYYAGDTGWSFDRDRRDDKLGAIMDQDRLYTKPPREHSKELLNVLRSLVEETENAVRNNLKTHAGMTWLEQSTLVQGLLYSWFSATKDRVV